MSDQDDPRYDPRSSKGERVKDPPTPESALAEMEMWLSILPKPERLHGADEDDVLIWARAVAKAGDEHADEAKGINAINAVTYAYRPEIFPYGPTLRSRTQHIFGSILRELDDESKRRREEVARAKAREGHDALRELKRSKGWA